MPETEPRGFDQPTQPGLARRLGWRHHGFRVQSQAGAVLALCCLLALPFAADQRAFQIRMHAYNPDLRGWLANAADLVGGPGPQFYANHPFYIYPPFFLTLIWPLTKLPVPIAAALFETIKWLALLGSLRIAWRLAAPRGEDVPPIVAVGSLLLTWRFIDNDLGQGNINLLLLWAVLGSCWWLLRGQHYAAGAAIGVAACVKVAPALLLVYFAYKGWWRPLLGAVLAAAVCLVIWPALCFGWEANSQLLEGWYNAVVAGFLERGAVRSEHTNQALVGIINRLFGTQAAILPDTRLTLIALPQWVRDMLRLTLGIGILAGVAWTCRRRIDPGRQPPVFAGELSLVLIAMLLLSGLSWKAHFVTMLLPYSVLLAYLADARSPSRHRRIISVLLLALFALCTLTSDIITPAGANYAEALGLIALGAVAAGVALAVALTQARRVGRAAGPWRFD